MPEGDTLFQTATTLRKALLGRMLTRFDTSVESCRTVIERYPPQGRTISGVEARGKHLLITLSPPEGAAPPVNPVLVVHTHLRMTGSWHIYRPGEAWQKPERLAKVVLHTDAFVAPCFNAPVVELLTERQAERHESLKSLGPDAITAEFDEDEAAARLRRHPDVPIGVGLMNQRAMSGVGNVFKSEVLFLRRVSPFTLIGDLDDATLLGLVQESHRLLVLNRERSDRTTRFGLNEGQRVWVYGRSGEPCRVCGGQILMRRQGLDGRSTYYCPQCQPAAGVLPATPGGP